LDARLRGVILTGQPAAPLRSCIRYYYQVQDRLGACSARQPVPARSPQIIEFTFGSPYRIQQSGSAAFEDAHPIALVGAQTHRRLDLLLSGVVDAFTMAFEPGGLSALFAIPAEELTNRHFDGLTTIGRKLSELHERLAAARTFELRIEVADRFLGGRLPSPRTVSPVVSAARRMHRHDGQVTVSDLAASVELGVRQFERRFKEEIGMPPKLYARVVRFEAALRDKATSPKRRWTEIAHDLGYFDQMHMVHDFNRLSGASPSVICEQLDMFVRPEVQADRSRDA
jgi:AraC-like DNA-binding protein